jgi:hypothetical protein
MFTNSINVFRNPNLSEWFNIVVNGKLVDNVRSHAKAMRIAKKIQKENKGFLYSSK